MTEDGIPLKLATWKSSLLDLTRRNRLIYYKRTKRSTLEILEPEPYDVFDRLASGKEWAFWRPPEAAIADAVLPEMYEQHAATHPGRSAGEVRADMDNRADLDATLLTLLRRSRSEFNERGVRILHLAIGLLRWQELDATSAWVESPLVLLPVELTRKDLLSPYVLGSTEEDPVLNPGLEMKLRTDFTIALPPCPDELDGQTLRDYIAQVQGVAAQKHWEVRECAVLSLFSFQKLVIYRDLVANAEQIAVHPVVRALAGAEALHFDDSEIVSEHKTDELHDPHEDFQVLPADSSQQACIQTAMRGLSFVMQGPPGTGKSQTIANIISECIARGKSVLFVSEKMAALEAVHKRLVAAKLHDFCLELHSHKADKREVARELGRCLQQRPSARQTFSAYDAEALMEKRRLLTAYVRELHLAREPSGWNAFDVIGRKAELDHTRYYRTGIEHVEGLTDGVLARLCELVSRIGHTWAVVEEGERFPWRGFANCRVSAGERQQLGRQLTLARDAVAALRREAASLAEQLGLATPEALDDLDTLEHSCELLARSPSPDRNWLDRTDIEDLRTSAASLSEMATRHKNECQSLKRSYGDAVFDLPPEAPADYASSLQRLSTLTQLTPDQCAGLFTGRHKTEATLEAIVRICQEWQQDADEIREAFALSRDGITVPQLAGVAELGCLCATEPRPDPSWLNAERLDRVKREIPPIETLLTRHNEMEASLLALYDAALFELDLDDLIERLAGICGSVAKWVWPGFYHLRKQVLRVTKAAQVPSTVRDDLVRAREVLRLRKQINARMPVLNELLGVHAAGYQTRFADVWKAVANAERAQACAGTHAPDQCMRDLIAAGSRPELAANGQRIQRHLTVWNVLQASLGFPVPVALLAAPSDPSGSIQLRKLSEWASAATDTLATLNAIADRTVAMREPEDVDFRSLGRDLVALESTRRREAEVAARSEELRQQFGGRFEGLGTNWEEVLHALSWTSQVLAHFGPTGAPERFKDLCISDPAVHPHARTFLAAKEAAAAHLQALEGMFGANHPLAAGVFYRNASLPAIREMIDTLLDRTGDLETWADHVELLGQLSSAGIADFLDALQQSPPPREQIGDAFLRGAYTEWLDSLFERVDVLRRFRREIQDEDVASFCALDEKSLHGATAEIIARAAERRPTAMAALAQSEARLVRAESAKRRRHLPLRKLFPQIAGLLPKLKPCLLMSPLSVSQFLDPHLNRFDLVIFDEASQVTTEDAIGAIYRGEQLIVAGDSKQLPPTRFFQTAAADDDYAEDEDAQYQVYESVLDECSASGLPSLPLRWHYRSRHEHLITFSNRLFYGGDLFTFPPASAENEAFGVKFDLVPDGIYERGRNQANINRKEAERVAELVFEHFRDYPDKTLGVVTFSLRQMTAVEDCIEARRRSYPSFEHRFEEDRLRGFFVKNLENVQGDERDILIFSVGYGKDAGGRMSLNFGPLNRDGGNRRLNVAITRAREKVIVVSSITARDIDVRSGENTGPGLLRQYLLYAEKGPSSLSAAIGEIGEPESPLEESVGHAINNLGYDCVFQVGCSGYRIDIGVLDPDAPGRFLLGVECDGAMYHSAASARDRDKLRQAILEDLGWRIYRVWSPEWASNRGAEVRRLREAIEAARVVTDDAEPEQSDDDLDDVFEGDSTDTAMEAPGEGPALQYDDQAAVGCGDLSMLPEFSRYRTTDLSTMAVRPELLHQKVRHPSFQNLLLTLVTTEGPIHKEFVCRRVADSAGRSVCDSLRNAIDMAASDCVYRQEFIRHGHFYWPLGLNQVPVRVPGSQNADGRRPLEWIAPEELQQALLVILRHCHFLTRDEIAGTMSRLFGVKRVTAKARQSVIGAIKPLLARGMIVETDGRVHLTDAGCNVPVPGATSGPGTAPV